MAWLGLFTAPDFDSSLDCALVGLLLVMMPLVGLANIAHLPLFNRGGGLFTYSKFAHGMEWDVFIGAQGCAFFPG